ncbi:MAG: discoidin domain-containing protein [Pirellulales bacterium]|jgi:hypothetical protein
MKSHSIRSLGLVLAVGMVSAWLTCAALRAAEAPKTIVGKDGQKLVALSIKLPKPLFQGTPKNLKPAPTLEKYDEKPRAPFYAPEGVTNLADKKPVTSSDSAPIVGELTMVTDGDKEGCDGTYVELAPGKQWIQIDLEKASDIYALVVWHFFSEGRVYHDVVVQVSDDPDFVKGVKTVYNNDFDNSSGLGVGKKLEYIDDSRGRLIDAKNEKEQPVRGRYVRIYSKANTSNDMNHYVEVEVYGKPAK